jgi:uncharacterized protein (UPF0332 family)
MVGFEHPFHTIGETFYVDLAETKVLDAQDIRNIGDYSIGPGVTADQVEESIHWAEEFLKAAETVLTRD